MARCSWCGREYDGAESVAGRYCSERCRSEDEATWNRYSSSSSSSSDLSIDGDDVGCFIWLLSGIFKLLFIWPLFWPYKLFGKISKPLGVILNIIYLMIAYYIGSKEEKESLSYIKLICTYYI